MATVKPTIRDISGDQSVYLIKWVLTSADNDGAPVNGIEWADRSVTIQSTAYGGATCAIEGCNDDTPTIYIPLADAQGTAISKSADGIESIVELTRWMRPRLSTVGAGATINVTMIARRASPRRGG